MQGSEGEEILISINGSGIEGSHPRPKDLPEWAQWRSDLGEISGVFNWSFGIGSCTPSLEEAVNHAIENERYEHAVVLLEVKRW